MYGSKTKTERKKSGAASSYQDLPADWYEAGKAERPLSQDERDHMIDIGLAMMKRAICTEADRQQYKSLVADIDALRKARGR